MMQLAPGGQRLLNRALNPLYQLKQMMGITQSLEDFEDEVDVTAVASMMSESMLSPAPEDMLPDITGTFLRYSNIVTTGTEHTCVHTAEFDTSAVTNEEPFTSHPFQPENTIGNVGPVARVTVPNLSVSMPLSTTCWHQRLLPEEMYQSSGSPKIWYGIPSCQANNFRKAEQILNPTLCQDKFLWLSPNNMMIPSNVLVTTQDELESMLAVPSAFSSCDSYMEWERVYFAPPSGLECLWKVFKEACESCEPTVLFVGYLLYNIECDKQTLPNTLEDVLPLYAWKLSEEVPNRQMLQERGLSFVQEVKGVPAENSVLCLKHALELLDTEQYYDTVVEQLQVIAKELHRVHVTENSVLCLKHALELLDTERYYGTVVEQLQVIANELHRMHDTMKYTCD